MNMPLTISISNIQNLRKYLCHKINHKENNIEWCVIYHIYKNQDYLIKSSQNLV